jgi:hypothetical protein
MLWFKRGNLMLYHLYAIDARDRLIPPFDDNPLQHVL